MRVIAGTLGGRLLKAPKGYKTHPMGDRVRGGLFATLGDISGLSLLDAFAGSGAISIEAYSRGARNIIAIDIDKNASSTIKNNLQALNIKDGIKTVRANASSWSDNNPYKIFDIVIAAPPYGSLQAELLQKLIRHVRPKGLYVLDWPGKMEAPQLDGLVLEKHKKYGDAQLVFYRKTE